MTDPGPPYQCVESIGRLGNVMFIYASSLGVARMGNRTLVVKPAYSLLPHFRVKALVDYGGHLCQKPKTKYDRGGCRFSPSLLQPEERFPVLRVGHYLQSWRYFAHVERDRLLSASLGPLGVMLVALLILQHPASSRRTETRPGGRPLSSDASNESSARTYKDQSRSWASTCVAVT